MSLAVNPQYQLYFKPGMIQALLLQFPVDNINYRTRNQSMLYNFAIFLFVRSEYKQGTMDNITQDQYEAVLHYMQDFHQDNFQQALKTMEQSNFNLQQARNRKKQSSQQNNNQNELHHVAYDVTQDYENQYNQLEQNQNQLEEQEQELSKMQKYLLDRVQSRIRRNRFQRYCQCLKKTGLHITQLFVPEMIKKKFIRSRFYQIYQDEAVIALTNKNLSQAVAKANNIKNRAILMERERIANRNGMNLGNINYKKNLFIIVSDDGKNHCIADFLKKKRLLNRIGQDFQIVGIIDNQVQNQFKELFPYLSPPNRKEKNPNLNNSHVSLQKNQNLISSSVSGSATITSTHPTYFTTFTTSISAPCILIMRQRHTQDLQLIQNFHGQQQILALNQEIMKEVQEKINFNINKQSELIKRITQRLVQQQFGRQLVFQNNRRLQTQAAQQFIQNRRQSKIIAQQNKQYKQMQRKKKQREQAELKRQQQIQQFIQQRQCRKLSLPQQPSEDQISKQNIIRIIFRCPNGENITRKFDRRQKCQILFSWVELNDEIQFEADQQNQLKLNSQTVSNRKNSSQKVITKERQFDLLYSYPPESLRQKIGVQLREVFEEEQIKILIRQL